AQPPVERLLPVVPDRNAGTRVEVEEERLELACLELRCQPLGRLPVRAGMADEHARHGAFYPDPLQPRMACERDRVNFARSLRRCRMQCAGDDKRRRLLAATAVSTLGALGGMPAWALSAAPPILPRPIPHSGEPLPVVGIGTAVVFDF